MADIEKWTTGARHQRDNSVLLAVPASSYPWSESLTGQIGGELATTGVGAVFGVIIIGLGAAWNEVRRFRNRKRRIGEREANERVTLLFYEDRVDIHRRRRVGKRIGDLKDSYPRSDFAMNENPKKLIFERVAWTISEPHSRKIRQALSAAGIVPRRYV